MYYCVFHEDQTKVYVKLSYILGRKSTTSTISCNGSIFSPVYKAGNENQKSTQTDLPNKI